MIKPDWEGLIGTIVCVSCIALIGYSFGLSHGSPINDITEIVWIDSHEKDWGKALEEGFDLVCRLVKND